MRAQSTQARLIAASGMVLLAAVIAGTPAAAFADTRSAAGDSAPSIVRPQAVNAEVAQNLVHEVVLPTGRFTLDLTHVPLRAEGFAVLEQKDDATFADVTESLGPDQSYLGTVRGRPDAYASATVMDNGEVWAHIVFGQGETWWTVAGEPDPTHPVSGAVPMPRPDWPYAWPSKGILPLEVFPDGGPYRYDFGVDVPGFYLNLEGGAAGSTARALALVEYGQNNVRATFMQQFGVTPALKEVRIRASEVADPYQDANTGVLLDEVIRQYGNCQDDGLFCDAGDMQSYEVISPLGLNGLALGVASASMTTTSGWFDGVARHEMGHNWGAGDMHAGGPEGPTIESGNDFARWDATELGSILVKRSQRAESGFLTPAPAFDAVPLPPNAVTDYLDRANSAASSVTAPLIRNDFSVNGAELRVASIDGRSANGARVTLLPDGSAEYTPDPSVPDGIDYFTYRLETDQGAWATGRVIVRNGPHSLTLEGEDGEPLGGAELRSEADETRRILSGDASLELGDGGGVRFTMTQPATRTVDIELAYWAFPQGTQFRTLVDGQEVFASAALNGNGYDADNNLTMIPQVPLTAGEHTIELQQITRGDLDLDIDYIRILSPNTAPGAVDASPLPTATEGTLYSASLADFVSDPDAPADAFTFRTLSGGSWLDIDPDGRITGVPPAGSAATIEIEATATDAFGYPVTVTAALTIEPGVPTTAPTTPPTTPPSTGSGANPPSDRTPARGQHTATPDEEYLASTGGEIGPLAALVGGILLAGGWLLMRRRSSQRGSM